MKSQFDNQVGGNHYNKLKIQPTQYVLANNLGYCEGNVIKYITRYQDKNGAEDLKKAIHYIQFILEDKYSVYSTFDIVNPDSHLEYNRESF